MSTKKAPAPWIAPLLTWFSHNAREMPWREVVSPYRTYLSEIMLQQTTVDTVRDYFLRFTQAFADVRALAAADTQDVLKLWEGLGYYTRAHNMMRCARLICEKHNGLFPDTFDALRALPGIGDYTAAAIASIAFGRPVPVVDGNVLRVYARLFACEDSIKSPAVRKMIFEALCEPIQQSGQPGAFNQALMELGALICKPKNPQCAACPVREFCKAYAQNRVSELPFSEPKKAVPHKYAVGFRIRRGNAICFHMCTEKLWHALSILPQSPYALQPNAPQDDALLAQRVLNMKGTCARTNIAFTHTFSHFRLTLNVVDFTPETDGAALRFYTREETEQLPLPAPYKKIVPALFDF